jgi:hypothetical protein
VETEMSIEAMRQALEVLEQINQLSVGENAIALPGEIDGAMDNLRAAIEQAEKQAPYIAVANDRITIDPVTGNVSIGIPAAPRQWVGLTEIEICDIEVDELPSASSETFSFARAIEEKLKEKNDVLRPV